MTPTEAAEIEEKRALLHRYLEVRQECHLLQMELDRRAVLLLCDLTQMVPNVIGAPHPIQSAEVWHADLTLGTVRIRWKAGKGVAVKEGEIDLPYMLLWSKVALAAFVQAEREKEKRADAEEQSRLLWADFATYQRLWSKFGGHDPAAILGSMQVIVKD